MLPDSNTRYPGDKSKGMLLNYVDQNEGPVRLNAMLALSYIGYAISEQVSRSQPFPLLIMPSLRTRESVDEAS